MSELTIHQCSDDVLERILSHVPFDERYAT